MQFFDHIQYGGISETESVPKSNSDKITFDLAWGLFHPYKDWYELQSTVGTIQIITEIEQPFEGIKFQQAPATRRCTAADFGMERNKK